MRGRLGQAAESKSFSGVTGRRLSMADRTNQQREDNTSRDTSRPSRSATDTANRTASTSTSTPAPGDRSDRGNRSDRTDQERALQTGREGANSTGLSRRTQTAPVYGPG